MSGFKLVPFGPENSAMVLAWRNSERIRSNMLDDSVIETADHSSFLQLLAEDQSKAYFVVELRNTPVAALYFAKLGGDEVTWGCYIGSEKIIPGLFVALLLIAIKYSFGLPTTNVLRSEVAAHNANSIKLHRFLDIPESGRFCGSTSSGEKVEFIEYRLFSAAREKVIRKAQKVMPSSMKQSYETVTLETLDANT